MHTFASRIRDLSKPKSSSSNVRRSKWASVKHQSRQQKSDMKTRSVVILVLLLNSILNPHCTFADVEGPIKTVVVLVMENRSFDHMLGWLKRLNPEIGGLTGAESNPVNTSDPNSDKVFVTDDAEFVDPDPGHSFGAIRQQIFGKDDDVSAVPPPMNGFVQQARTMNYGPDFPERVMSAFRPEVIPVSTSLAMEFAIFDRWFASAPTSTQPNRLYVHSATSHGAISNVKADLVAGYPQKPIMESVADAGLSWGVYYQNIPATLFFKDLRKIENLLKFKPYEFFELDASAGKLPNYVVIEQRYFDMKAFPANDDHPAHDVAEGQRLMKEVYEILRASPQWNEMLFLITYDEHGGFFDHVPTPVTNVPNPDGMNGPAPDFFPFNRLGVRVPTIAISPWINKGQVVHEPSGPTPNSQFEHSSISATVKKIFGLPNFLTKRDEWAGTFDHLLSQRTQPREDCPTELPTPPWSLRHVAADENRKLTQFQEELVLLASQITGDHTLKNYPFIGRNMTVKQGNDYVTNAVARFIGEAKKRASQGGDLSKVLQLEALH